MISNFPMSHLITPEMAVTKHNGFLFSSLEHDLWTATIGKQVRGHQCFDSDYSAGQSDQTPIRLL
ncbi:hypothetical protein K7432_014130 [Basidiobolus ranarum]|uniref:Uncharacterized protein n=1 Tax=Basidiobolus ranarum TaxID=34480 RepID=A0ABR2VPW2_9FUNG